MSDPYRSSTRNNNIALKYFDDVKAVAGAQTNLYSKNAAVKDPINCSALFLHGMGGSPVETSMKESMESALNIGAFRKVYALENMLLSATCDMDMPRNILDANLDNHTAGLKAGLLELEKYPDFMNSEKTLGFHSLGAWAFVKAILEDKYFCRFVDRVVFYAPYTLTADKLLDSKRKYVKRKKSEDFEKVIMKSYAKPRFIEGVECKFPTCAKVVLNELDPKWRSHDENGIQINNLPIISRKASMLFSFRGLRRVPLYVILPTADTMAEFQQTYELFRSFKWDLKTIQCIPDANHFFDNKPQELRIVLDECVFGKIHQEYLEKNRGGG